MNYRLVIPNKKYEQEWEEYANEYIAENPTLKPLEYTLDMNYDEWLKTIEEEKNGINLKKGRVPSTKFFLIDNNERILGGISLRHNIDSEYLLNYGGHIGYGIRPSERKKGYGNLILKLGLQEANKLGINRVLITCFDDNFASQKIIENNGGIIENKTELDSKLMCRYWINIE